MRTTDGRQEGDTGRPGMAITCRTFVEFLDDYVSGVLPEAERAAFNAHLAACPPCVAYMKSYRATVQAGKAALSGGDEPVPAEVPEDLLRAVLAACRRP